MCEFLYTNFIHILITMGNDWFTQIFELELNTRNITKFNLRNSSYFSAFKTTRDAITFYRPYKLKYTSELPHLICDRSGHKSTKQKRSSVRSTGNIISPRNRTRIPAHRFLSPGIICNSDSTASLRPSFLFNSNAGNN